MKKDIPNLPMSSKLMPPKGAKKTIAKAAVKGAMKGAAKVIVKSAMKKK
jgi:hypothetical protein